MKNKLLKTLFLFIMIFSLSVCGTVSGLDGIATNDPGTKWGSTSGASNWSSTAYEGIRITLVDSNGDRVEGTVSADYFSSYEITQDAKNKTCSVTSTISSKKIESFNYNKYAATKGMRKEVDSSVEFTAYNVNKTYDIIFNTLDFYPYYGIIDECPWASDINAGDYFEKYFLNMDKTKLYSILSELTNNKLDEYLPESKICGGELYFVIEPLTRIKFDKTTLCSSYVGTVTELAHIYQNAGAPSGLTGFFPDIAFSIYLDESETLPGFNGFKGVKNTSIGLTDVLNNEQGYAIGVFKLSKYADCSATCWKPEITCDTTSCDNVKENNVRTCEKTMTSYTCEFDEYDEDYNKYGEKTYVITKDCSLFCTETATVSYPGNVSPAIGIYEAFAWPTKDGDYPLTTTAKLTCKALMNDGSAANQVCKDTLQSKNYNYVDGDNSTYIEYENIKKNISASLERNCTSKNSVSGDNYSITRNCTYTLPSEKNIAIDKKTAELLDKTAINFAEGVSNWILLQNGGVLPESGYSWVDDSGAFESLYDEFSGTDTFGKGHCLEVKDLSLGYEGTFTSKLNSTPYICSYNITLAPEVSCICPPGTKWSGKDMYATIKDTAQTCAEAKEIYCNQETITPPKYNNPACPPDSKYPERNCTDYINNGGTEAECIANWCNDTCTTNCDYVCPKTSDYPGMDISSCVSGQLGAGKKLAQALSYCIEKNCYRGANIIYRTISLENPFPSKDADLKVNQTGLTKGMFNTTIKGRYPGTNWNSVTLVKNKILNNRGYNGSEIYEKAKPLYVIELDPTAIKKIREYNKKQEDAGGYADFTLKCTDGAYCISSFIRSGITTADGTNMLTGGKCASASNKKTFTNCYTYK